MKKFNKAVCIVLAITTAVICAVTAYAVTLFEDGDYTYADIDSDHVALYNYTGDSDVLTVPEYFSNRIVSLIYDYAFENNTRITRIDFSANPRHITSIGIKAFAECTSLTGELSLPSSLDTLGFAAFQGCTGLTSLTVNMGVNEIPIQCFNRCSGLTEVRLAGSVEKLDNLAFGNCTKLNKVYLPSSVTEISNSAFYNCTPTLYVHKDSYAHQYAVNKGFDYVVVDAAEPTEPTEPETEPTTDPPTDPETVPVTEPETETQITTVTFILGDADGDGFITILDATKIQRVLAGLDHDEDGMIALRGNVGESDVLNIIHATKIQRFLADFEVAEPIGTEVTREISA